MDIEEKTESATCVLNMTKILCNFIIKGYDKKGQGKGVN